MNKTELTDAEKEEVIQRRMNWIDGLKRFVAPQKTRRGADHVGRVLDEAARAAKKLKQAGYDRYEQEAAAESAGKEVERIMKG